MLHAVEEGDTNGVHRARVASRRLREVLPVLPLDADLVDRLGRRLRKITKRLGRVRELDVLIGIVSEVRGSGRHSDIVLERVGAAIEADRRRTRKRHIAKSQMRELRRVGAKLEKVVRTLERRRAPGRRAAGAGKSETSNHRRSHRWAIEARVGRRASTLERSMAHAGTVYLPDRLHAVRIAVKKLRYALELDHELAGAQQGPQLRLLRRTQNVLGRLHDLQVLIDRIRHEQASLIPPDINVWRELDGLVTSIEDQCRRLHGRYVREVAALMALCSELSGRVQDVRHQTTARS
ncbi:MAG TPA: CHAD domain-containing protein [Vicinamibacterales bacterium]|jgi:CHAD domain-containing protein|nr:CHAD domain-containing protein [Vicinamibacterales bacterium]